MHIIEPCCLHRQIDKIIAPILANSADDPTTLAWSNGDWGMPAILSHICGYASTSSELTLCIPQLTADMVSTIANILNLTYRPSVNEGLRARLAHLTLLTNKGQDIRNAIIDQLSPYAHRVTYAENAVASSVIILQHNTLSLSIIGSIPASGITARGALHAISLCTSPDECTRMLKVINSKIKRHTVELSPLTD